MKVSYLIIWQLGNNEQTRTETPVDVIINEVNSAEEKYARIFRALIDKTGEDENVTILSVSRL